MRKERFARKCDATGVGISEGFCFFDGSKYFKNESDALKYAIELGYASLPDAYNRGAYYWTQWETPYADEEHYLIDGTYVPEKEYEI